MLASKLATQLLPLQQDAVKALAEWTFQTRKLTTSVVTSELSNDSLSRLRFRAPPLRMFECWGPAVSRVFSLYWTKLSPLKRRELHYILNKADLFRPLSEDDTFDAFKGLSNILFHYRTLISMHWQDYMHLHLMRDYKPSVPMIDLVPEVRDWVQSKPVHTILGSEQYFLDLFRLGVRDFLNRAPCRLDNYHPITDELFVTDPYYWATSGSSDTTVLEVEVAGSIHRAAKTKWASAMALNTNQLLEMLTKPAYQNNHVIQKRELGKVRPVVASDFATNLKMSRVAYWFEAAMKGHGHSTLFMSSTQTMQLWHKMIEQANDPILIKEPIDQGHFDHSVNLKMIIIILSEMRMYIEEHCHTFDRDQILAALRQVRYAISSGTVELNILKEGPNGVKKLSKLLLQYMSGICSGWRFTALFDTLANAGELYAFCSHIRSKTGHWPITDDWVCQGDDIRLVAISYPAAVAIWALYTEAGFDVNPLKFFISNKEDEFLRQSTRLNWIAGYPARLASLVFRNPVTRELMRGEERIREMLTTWNQVFNRFGYTEYGPHWRSAITDIAQSNHLTVTELLQYCATPSAVGGCGLLFNPAADDQWVSIDKGTFTTNWSLIKTPPLATHLSTLSGLPADDFTKLWIENVSGPRNKTKITYSGFTIKRLSHSRILNIPIPNSSVYHPMAPTFNGTVTPSVSALIVKRTIRDRNYSRLKDILTIRANHVLNTLISSATQKVINKWLLGRLPYSTPIRPGWSSAAVSYHYKPVADAAWARVLNYTHITYPLLLASAVGAELTTRVVLSTQVYRVGG